MIVEKQSFLAPYAPECGMLVSHVRVAVDGKFLRVPDVVIGPGDVWRLEVSYQDGVGVISLVVDQKPDEPAIVEVLPP